MGITLERKVTGVSMGRNQPADPAAKPDAAVVLSCGHTVEAPDGPIPLTMHCRICAGQAK